MEGDLAEAAFDWQHSPDGVRDVIDKYRLDAERLSGVHPVELAPGQATLTRDEVEALLKGHRTARAMAPSRSLSPAARTL